jgi:hypothetical protein
MDCCTPAQPIDAYFDEHKARREAAQCLKSGLASHAKAMLDAVSGGGVQDASVLEVGGALSRQPTLSCCIVLFAVTPTCQTWFQPPRATLAGAWR